MAFVGSLVGKPDDWRKMSMKGGFSPSEAKLLGAGGAGSEWMFQHAGGEFTVQFRGDGYNHFVCQSYPAHAHWTLGGDNRDELTINWADYGIYELRVDGALGQAEGCLKGAPEDWRRMRFLRDLGSALTHEAEECPAH
jgi:hypothetical protein